MYEEIIETEERIARLGADIFSKIPVDRVPVSEFTDLLGITEKAFYKHFSCVEEVPYEMADEIRRIYKARKKKLNIPQKGYNETPEAYENITLKDLKEYVKNEYKFWTEDEFASGFVKMLNYSRPLSYNCFTLDLFSSFEKWASEFLLREQITYLTNAFQSLIDRGVISDGDPKQCALNFYLPTFYSLYSHTALMDYELRKCV